MAGKRVRNGTLAGLEVGGEELADLLGLNPGSVTRLATDHGMPRSSRGRYPVADCVRWYAERLKVRAIESPTDLQTERRLLITSQCEGQELANESARAAMLDAGLVATAVQRMGELIGARLDEIPRIAPELARLHDVVAIRRRVADATHECRRQAAADMAAFADSLADAKP